MQDRFVGNQEAVQINFNGENIMRAPSIIIEWFDRYIEAEIIAETATHYSVRAVLVEGKKALRWDLHKDSDAIVHPVEA